MYNFWDQRYSEPGFAYGRKPNDFFMQIIDELTPGRLLLPGEGEGRNAIYAAGKGWDVTAIDQSVVARDKARMWADSLKLDIHYIISDLAEYSFTQKEFDLIAIIYVHFPPELRKRTHARLRDCLRPGGKLIIECFHKTQLSFKTGGPEVEELLYSEEDLRADFQGMNIEQCRQEIRYKEEGKYHAGESSIIRFIANQPPKK